MFRAVNTPPPTPHHTIFALFSSIDSLLVCESDLKDWFSSKQ